METKTTKSAEWADDDGGSSSTNKNGLDGGG